MGLFDKEQLILVTGASSGIGRACAHELIREGATVVASGRDARKLEEAGASSPDPQRWHSAPLDLAGNIDRLADWLGEQRQKHGKFHGLLHAAGELVFDSLEGLTPDQARRHFELNFLAPVFLARAFARQENSHDNSSLVVLASISGEHPEKGLLLYGSAKAALIAAVKAMSQEISSRGLRANCVSPAMIDTPMLDGMRARLGDDYMRREIARYPLGLGKPGDVANLACFLLSQKASWITGQNFTMDGGEI